MISIANGSPPTVRSNFADCTKHASSSMRKNALIVSAVCRSSRGIFMLCYEHGNSKFILNFLSGQDSCLLCEVPGLCEGILLDEDLADSIQSCEV